MKHIVIIAMGLALAMPLHANNAVANAGAKKANPARIFKKKDKDGDGFLTKAEFIAGAKNATKAETVFAKKDKNSDGKLSKEEFAGGGKGREKAKGKGKKAHKEKAKGKGKKAGKGKGKHKANGKAKDNAGKGREHLK
jgi:EF hand